MPKNKTIKLIFDSTILIFSLLLIFTVWKNEKGLFQITLIIAAVCAIGSAFDIFYQCIHKSPCKLADRQEAESCSVIQEMVLLDEKNKPIKSWPIAGKTALVIGRKNDDEDVDIDLEDCEYSTFVEYQHAALNYCLDHWYLEDLGSSNGVRVKKAEDGVCYKISNRPCMVMAGDIIYIANTKLLLT